MNSNSNPMTTAATNYKHGVNSNDLKALNKKHANGTNGIHKLSSLFNAADFLDGEEFKIDWNTDSSQYAKNTINPVRRLVEQMKIEPNPNLQMIALSIGDPIVLSELGKPDTVKAAILKCIDDKKFDGYGPSFGTETARQAVAKYQSRPE